MDENYYAVLQGLLQNTAAIRNDMADIGKDVDKMMARFNNYGGNMNDNVALPFIAGMNANNANNANNMWPAMMMANGMNGWGGGNALLYLIFLAMFGGWGNGGFGFGNNNNGMAAAAMMNNANSAETTNLLMNAINNSNATSQRDFDRLASNLGVTGQTLTQGIYTLNTSLAQIAGQMGMSTQQVINAIQSGDCGIRDAVQQCCCENRLAICQQTNTLQQGQFQLGVTMQREGELTRGLIANQAYEAQIRQLTRENEQLRDAAQTATLQGSIAAGDAAIQQQLTAIQTQLGQQIVAQGFQIQALQSKIGESSAASASTGA